MRWTWLAGSLLTVLFLTLLPNPDDNASAQQPEPPSTWVVTGQVLDAVTGDPLPGALVCHEDNAANTDDEGRFRFEIPAQDEPVIWISARAGGHQGRGIRWNAGTDHGQPVVFRLPRTVQLTGRVVDEAGEPVADAEVRVRMGDRDDFWDERPVSVYTTDSDGEFRSRAFRVTDYELRVEAEGHAVALLRVEAEEAHEPLQVVLRRGASMTGRVVGPKGSPVPEARILLAATPDPPDPWASRREVLFETTAEPGGGFRFSRLPEQRFDLEATAPGWAPTTLPSVEIPRQGELDLGEIRLQPAVVLEGRVEDLQGRPIQDATVEPERELSEKPRPFGALPAVETDEKGRFAIEDLRPGEPIRLKVTRQGYFDAWAGALASASVPVEIVLTPGARISGVAVWPNGEPAAEVFLRGALHTESYPSHREIYGRTDAEGRFVLDGLRAGQVSLVAVTPSGKEDWSSPPKSFQVAEGARIDAGRLILEPAGQVSGRVLGPDGQPLPRAKVVLRRKTEKGAAIEDSWTADVGGGFTFFSVAPGPWEISVRASGHQEQTRDVEVGPGPHWLEFDLSTEETEEKLRISGRVVDAEGNPVASADVDFHTKRSTTGTGTGPDGKFSLHRDVEPGAYRISASAPGWAETEYDQPVVLEDRPIEGIVIRLRRGASVSGRVTGVETSGLGQVAIEAMIQTPDEYQKVLGEVDFEGRYRIRGLSAGSWKIWARGPDGQLAVEEVVVAEEGALSRDLRLTPGETLRGRVLFHGEAVAGLKLHLRAEPGLPDRGLPEHQAVTDGAGRFEFVGLESGHYGVGGVDSRTGLRVGREVEIPTTEELLLTSEGTVVRGRVLGAAGESAPVSKVSVILSPLDPEGLGTEGDTGPDGRFAATVSQGRFRLALSHEKAGARVMEIETAGPQLDLGDLALEPGGALVLDLRWNAPTGPEKDPLPLQAMLLAEKDGGPVARWFGSVEPGKPVRLDGLPPGSWRLLFSSWQTGVTSLPVTVPEGEAAAELAVTLPPATAIRVRVPGLAVDSDSGELPELVLRDDRGERFPMAMVLQENRLPLAFSGFGDGTVPVESEEVVIALLPPGTWTVEVTDGDDRSWKGEVTTRPDELAELVLE